SDQEHLPVALLSLPEKIEDRTRYLMRETDVNPAFAVADIIGKLENLGAKVVGIPCNTMHAPEIFNEILHQLEKKNSEVKVIHMIREVVGFIARHYPNIRKVGILSTTGTWKSNIYPEYLGENKFEPLIPDKQMQEQIHEAIYNPRYGIKAQSDPVDEQAKKTIVKGLRLLKSQGAEGIIPGCTEVSFALPYTVLDDLPLFDPTLILARALIAHTYPEKLKDFNV
ncbi:MAG: aspartate/glutamate racemase family protein, partial [Bacteroidales bacterium]|nr:aspartate/glutamate racemase family protein [Bacteroidales bacterium]